MKSNTPSGETKANTKRAPRVTEAATKAPTKAAPRRNTPSKASDHRIAPISAEERLRMIEVCAYFRAQQRGFAPGSEQQDWLDAEAQIDSHLTPGVPPLKVTDKHA